MKIAKQLFGIFVFILFAPGFLNAQSGDILTVTDAALKGDTPVELGKLPWKYHAGDDVSWAARDYNDASWETIEGTTVKPELLSRPDWNGRAWFRLRFKIEDKLVGQNIVLSVTQKGASEIYLDSQSLAKFGEITDASVSENNPNRLPIPFRLDDAGEHSIAIRFASSIFQDASGMRARWLTNGGVFPGVTLVFLDGSDLNASIRGYGNYASMRTGFLFVGVLLGLALLHFLLYLFYRVERANLFYSFYAVSFALFLIGNNVIRSGHQATFPLVITVMLATTMLATTFVALLAFLHVAFGRRLGKLFWILTGLWALSLILHGIFLNNAGVIILLTNVLIALSFTFSIMILVIALREKRAGAWILMIGVQILMFGMFLLLLANFKVFLLPEDFSFLAELAIILGVPVAVSVYLARNFARTNRDLKTQLAQVETLSAQKIEQEKQAAELRAENERRAKELEEARQLQLSMLPKKLPQIPNLEIAAYMKPASEVGGDYYDFHVADDGTLTIAVGDATGHGLKAGTMVTATKSLFNNLAHEAEIENIFRQSSTALKKMNLRGMFMAMTMAKIKNSQLIIGCAGMPSALVYRNEINRVEEISIKAMPWGSPLTTRFEQREMTLGAGDTILLMSDGFPEMFNEKDEMLGFDKARKLLSVIAAESAEEIINCFVEVGEKWAGARPPDDDVTFVVLKVKRDS